MTTTTIIDQWRLQERLINERPRLLGLCAYLTGDPDSAEDLVQEVLLEAWRSFANLRNPDAMDAWLNGIVRNVCARWLRTYRRNVLLPDRPEELTATNPTAVFDTLVDSFDLDLMLDRQELAELLDRALALLPKTTREVLVRKYIAESRHAEIADQLGMNENAVTVCLHRGKIALRKVLTTQLRSEAEAFGLVIATDEWVETRLWCTLCGQRRLMGKLTATEFALRCPTCSVEPDDYLSHWNWSGGPAPLGPVRGFRPIGKRLASLMFQYWMTVLHQAEHHCPVCHAPLPLYQQLPADDSHATPAFRGIRIVCERCNAGSSTALFGLALSSPAGLAFFQAHPRLRLLPEREIEFQGAPALVQSFASVTDGATFEVMMHQDTCTILASYRSDET